MLTFTNTSTVAKPRFRFSYDGGLVTFDFNVVDPTTISHEAYLDLAKAVLTVKNGKAKPRYFSFKDSNDGQYIKLIAINELLFKVQFTLYSIDHKLKITLPFQLCEEAFIDAARWRASLPDSD